MPEFEKTQPEPDPQHNYSPSTDTSKKTGGRRRSGGFKTEIPSSPSGIGEVDPSEALKGEKLSGSAPSQDKSTPKSESSKSSDETPLSENSKKDAKVANDIKKAPAKSSKPQPSEATLAAIKKVEARIEKRQENNREKGATDRKTKPGNRKTNSRNNRKPAKGGMLAAIAQFFGNLFGGTSSKGASGSASGRTRNRSYGKKPASRNYDGNNQRGNSRPRRKNNPQRRNGKNRQHNGQGSATK